MSKICYFTQKYNKITIKVCTITFHYHLSNFFAMTSARIPLKDGDSPIENIGDPVSQVSD